MEFAAAVLTRRGWCAMLDAMARHKPMEIPPDLRTRLETARLDLLALFRALDRMCLTPDQIPQRLIRQLFELDADYVEALWGLDQPPGKLNLQLMLRDTLAALDQLPTACSRLRKNLPPQTLPTLSQFECAIRANLNPAEAYNMVPDRNPQIV
jgi:hypothetical protein